MWRRYDDNGKTTTIQLSWALNMTIYNSHCPSLSACTSLKHTPQWLSRVHDDIVVILLRCNDDDVIMCTYDHECTLCDVHSKLQDISSTNKSLSPITGLSSTDMNLWLTSDLRCWFVKKSSLWMLTTVENVLLEGFWEGGREGGRGKEEGGRREGGRDGRREEEKRRFWECW